MLPIGAELVNLRYFAPNIGAFLLTKKSTLGSSSTVMSVMFNTLQESRHQLVAFHQIGVYGNELETFQTYPVEIIAGLLYMGDHRQASDCNICEDLKISVMVKICQSSTLEFEKGNHTILNIPVADSVMSNLYSSFERLCAFIGSHLNMGCRILVFSSHGISRCSAVTIAFLMFHLKHTLQDPNQWTYRSENGIEQIVSLWVSRKKGILPKTLEYFFKEAWECVLKCKTNIRPNRGFIQQLSDWELHTMGRRLTDISEPNF